jgi:uncharacterized protein (TIGR02246 family)
MRLKALALVMMGMLVLSVAGCATPGPGATGPSASQDRDGIRATLAALNSSCAARDLDAFMALFDDGDDILMVGSDTGEVFRGREAVREFMNRLFGLPFVFSFDLKEVVTRQDRDFAWVFVDGNMVHSVDRGAAAGKVSQKPYRFSIAMVRKEGRWRWQLFNGSVPGAE